MTVLVLTWSGDAPAVQTVCDQIAQRGVRCFRVDTDRLATDVTLALESSKARCGALVRSGDRELDTREVRAVWYRRLHAATNLPDGLSPSMRSACWQETKAALHGWLATLEAFHVDREERVVRASHKPLQLETARALGLDVPATLITNDAEAARGFRDACRKPLIAKPLTHFRVDEDGSARVVLTSAVEDGDLDDAEGLALSPMVFQERLEKALDLRAVVVGSEVFAAAVDSQAFAHTAVDWRQGARELVGKWSRYELPSEVAARLVQLVARFGLQFGALDLVLTPDGRHVFLELNPQGEFSWLADAPPHIPIATSLADLLVRGAR